MVRFLNEILDGDEGGLSMKIGDFGNFLRN